MCWRIVASLLIVQILALAGGVAGHCDDDHSAAVQQLSDRGPAPSPDEDCDHCFLCTGVAEEPPSFSSMVAAERIGFVEAPSGGNVIHLRHKLDLPPKL